MSHSTGPIGIAAALVVSFVVAAAPAGTVDQPSATGEPVSVSWSFDDVSTGQLPAGWRTESTNGNGDPAIWRVVADKAAPTGKKVLALFDTNRHHGSTFNLCWTDSVSFLDGEIAVRFRADQGREDQGGSVIWRVQDRDNYYIARFNPLEDNFRLYSVRNGSRRTLASAEVALAPGQWHLLTITQHGNRYSGALDGKVLLTGTNDLFTAAGGVGLWTKADAATSFADFSVDAGGGQE